MPFPEGEPQRKPELLDDETRVRLPKLYSQEEKGLEVVAQVKFFTPTSHWTWYTSEGSFVDEDGFIDTDKPKAVFLFFGLVSGNVVELGHFSLNELASVGSPLILPIERDLFYKPTTLRELMAMHDQQHRY
jgi:hypothetical protein